MERVAAVKSIARLTFQLFATTILVGAFGFALTWWHHSRSARTCLDSVSSPEPATCSSYLWLFGMSWLGWAAFLLLLFCFCMLVTWGWLLVRRKPG